MVQDKVKLVYCADGPARGQTISAFVEHRKITIPLHSNPFYESAVYFVTGGYTGLGEAIAVFSHCRRRSDKNEQAKV
jgi:hypothetical protein